MENFSIEQLSFSVITILGGIGGLLHVIQRSRCRTINCCFGLSSCERTPPTDEEPDIEKGITLPSLVDSSNLDN